MAHDKTGPSTWTHECRRCHSPLIQAAEWTRQESGWKVNIACPECFSRYDLLLDQEQVTQLSYALEAGFHTLLEDLDELDRDMFQDECDSFIAALRAGSIFPMDF
ncbi:MAG: hypothetical protein Kow00129_12120 [Thermoleophilia bacterium]